MHYVNYLHLLRISLLLFFPIIFMMSAGFIVCLMNIIQYYEICTTIHYLTSVYLILLYRLRRDGNLVLCLDFGTRERGGIFGWGLCQPFCFIHFFWPKSFYNFQNVVLNLKTLTQMNTCSYVLESFYLKSNI